MASPPPYDSRPTSPTVEPTTSPVSRAWTDLSPLTLRPSSAYAAVAMQGRDKLRFIQFPDDVPRGAESVVRSAWPEGIQTQQLLTGGSYEYKLSGNPFGSMGDKGGVASRVLVRDVLAYLYSKGWLLDTALNQTRSLDGKDTLIFRQAATATTTAVSSSPGISSSTNTTATAAASDKELEATGRSGSARAAGPSTPPPPLLPPVDWMAVGISKSDGLRLIGCSQALVQALRRELERLDAFQSAEWNAEMGVDGGFEFKLKGRPWRAYGNGDGPIRARMLILRIIEVLDGFGWRSYAAICQRSGNDSYQKADTWYFIKAQDYVAGSPFNSEPVRRVPALDS